MGAAAPLILLGAGGLMGGFAKRNAGMAQAQFLRHQADQVRAKGSWQAGQLRERGTRVNAAVTARAGASGVDAASKSVADVTSGNAGQSALDAAMARFNAINQANNLEWQASATEAEANASILGSAFGTAGEMFASAYGSGMFSGAGNEVGAAYDDALPTLTS